MMAFFGDANLVVSLSFLIFIGILVYLRVPSKLAGMLDDRAERIRKELDDARRLREEAQAVLASYERKQKEVEELAQEIVTRARAEAARAAEEGKKELEGSIARRLKAAEEQIASAEAAAIRDVKDRAVQVAIRAAAKALSEKMDGQAGGKLIDDAIASVGAKLH